MQTTLLGLAIAIILALVTALVAPLVVDWNRYRATFEEEASRLTGLTVRVNGTIDARILPIPHIQLRDIEVGEAGSAPRMRAGSIELEVGLGPLLRGKVQATELRLVAPQLELALDATGAVDWPAASPSFRPEALTISRFHVEDGRVVLSDAGSGARLVLQRLRFDGDIRSFVGPFQGEGAFAAGDDVYRYRISGGRLDQDGSMKLRFKIDPSDRPLAAEVDGKLSFDRGAPQFDGTLSLARPAAVTLADGERVISDPWQLAGKLRATPAAASLQDLTFQYGPDERAVNFSGKAELTFGAHPHLDGAVAAVQVDVDRMLAAPDLTHRPPFVLLKSFVAAAVATVKPPVPTSVGLAIEAMTVGGATIQSLHGNVGFDAGGWRVNALALRAPGSTDVKLSGRLDDGPQGLAFSGPASLQSADLKTLTAWIEDRRDQPSGPAEALTAQGEVAIGGDRLALDRLSAVLDRESVEGRLVYTWAAGNRPASLDGELRAAKLDVDALIAFAKNAAADSAFEVPRNVALVLDVGKATLAGVEARKIDARLTLDAGTLHVDRFSVGDLGGAALNVGGRVDELSSQPRGRLTLDVDATTLAGLVGVVGRFAPRVSASLQLFADRLAPAKVHGVLMVERREVAGAVATLDFGGDLGAMRLALHGEAAGEPAQPEAAVVHLESRLTADDGEALVRLLHLDHVVAVDQLPGQMIVSASGPLGGDVHVNSLATAGGFSAAATGLLRLSGEQAPWGDLQLKASAADLQPLRRAMTGQPGQPGAAVPITASATVAVAGARLSFQDLAVSAAKSSLHGRLAVRLSNPVAIDGDVAADDVDAAAVTAMLLGLPSAAPGAGRPWSSQPIGAGAFGAWSGDVAFMFDRAALLPTLVARNLKGAVRLEPSQITVRDIDGSLAGGRLSADFTFHRDSEKLAAQGRLELTGANAAMTTGLNKNVVDGLLALKLQADGAGLSPDGLIGALHGSGTIALTNAQFMGMDPAAFEAAIVNADRSGSIDAPKIAAVVGAAMEKGRLIVAQGDADVTIAAGRIRLANATLRAQGGAALSLDGALDLDTAAIDASMTLVGPPAANALIPARPELAVSVKGPLAAPERRLDLSALVGWLTMRATEQQTRRLESIEANQRSEIAGHVVRPASPSIRFVPQGTALESAGLANPVEESAPGARQFDRLRSAAPAAGRTDYGAATVVVPPAMGGKPAAPRPAPGADKATTAAGTAQPTPQPASRSPLDLLFHSQN